VTGITFDAGGLIALDRNDRRIIALIARVGEVGGTVVIPATALAQAIRQPERQARLSRFIRQPNVQVVPLDRLDGISVGRLLATTRTADVVDAHVAICARRADHRVVTSDGADLAALDPTLQLILV
jgi:limonene-1,2-epoxide hydrolase